jgi:hypothetical protein
MNYNPYAAPQAPQPPGLVVQPGSPQPWEIGETLGVAWEAFKRNWAVLLFTYFLASILSMIPYVLVSLPMIIASGMAQSSKSEPPVPAIGLLLPGYAATAAVLLFFYVGLVRIWVLAARGGQPAFSLLFSGGGRYLPFLGVGLLFGIGTYLGLFFLVVPGVILWCGWLLAPFYVVDAEMGAIDSFKQSWAATSGQKGKLFLFGLFSFGLTIALELTCCGIFVVGPLLGVMWAVVCLRISGRGNAAGSAVAPPGYGGFTPGYPPPGV